MGTILLAGIYGVGKSTLAEKLTDQTGIPNYSAGDLISSRNGEKYGANKLVADKDKNQEILAEVVSALLQKHDRILLAGHFCIVNKQGQVDKLPDSVYKALDIEQIILLEAPRDVILSHLAGRDRKEYSETLVQALMDQERAAAEQTAAKLQCPLVSHAMTYSDADAIALIAML